MKFIAKFLSLLIPIKAYRKPFLKWLENVLWCGDMRNIHIWKIRRKAIKVGKELVVSGKSKVNSNTIIGDNVELYGVKVFGKGKLTIGAHTIIAGECKIITQNHNYEGERIPYDDSFILKEVTIGSFVWIGTDVLILPGTTIGEGAIIQGGSVVHGEIPPYAIAGGNPAKVFAYRNEAHFKKLKRKKMFYGN